MNFPLFMEGVKIVPGFCGAAGDASSEGDRVSLENYGRCAILVIQDQGGANSGNITVNMHTAATSGTTSTGITVNQVWSLEDVTTGTTADTWTAVAAAATFATSASATLDSYYLLDIDAEDLFSAGTSYPFISVLFSGGHNSNLMTAIYFLYQPRYAEDALPSAQS